MPDKLIEAVQAVLTPQEDLVENKQLAAQVRSVYRAAQALGGMLQDHLADYSSAGKDENASSEFEDGVDDAVETFATNKEVKAVFKRLGFKL